MNKKYLEVETMSKIEEVAKLVEMGKAKLVGKAVQEALDEAAIHRQS